MGAVEDLGRAIGYLQSQYEARKEQNRQIQAKIDALEKSKRLMKDALHKAENLRDNVGKQKADSWWNGALANAVTDHITASRSRANSIVRGIEDGIGEIDSHIWKLRMEYDYIVGLLNGLEDSIDTKNRERQRAIVEANSSGGGVR